ncbi:ATP-dependent DNA helicase RecG [Phascolarctobacterium sp.]|uniref:ATP-dependent DNA helicase RecG n=1 Tax=Phascolarctobacterium sp. TaxID=2049039 RepID=UPI0025F4020E|nr:ATP-dependent DNA helicase RecG [uncultured Phascolarctobacterium sp.]
MWWREPVTSLKGIGTKKALDFQKLNIETVGDLLNHYPRLDSYLDYSKVKKITELTTTNEKQFFAGEIFRLSDRRSGRGSSYAVITVKDDTDFAEIFLFAAQRYQMRFFKPGMQLLVVGKVRAGTAGKMVSEAFIQVVDSNEAASGLGILPVYALAGSLKQGQIRTAVKQALAKAEKYLPETLPEQIIAERNLPDRLTALRNIHFPESFAKLEQAKQRFIFEELFLLQCGLLYYRDHIKESKAGLKHGVDGDLLRAVIAALPFKLTEAQQQAWQEISLDMQESKPMHRLLQGDVGSGKTAISALALAKTAENGYQGCIMVPTEILAQQHFETLSEYLTPHGLRVELLTSSVKKSKRKVLLEDLELGEIDILVGTHAVIQDDVVFNRLALVITDEQHRFGVAQRAKLSDKSQFAPDTLIMTATPIPRTLALTVYGDLDISVMQGKPIGRKPIETLCYTGKKRPSIYAGMVRQVQAGHQVYVVCALIDDSEGGLQARSATEVYQELKYSYLKNIPCALLHGKMKNQEKDEIMRGFAAGEIKVLVTTTVIEVGVNVPNATLMIIENADRFGLAQMHQLRGRVGRGDEQSYCVLLTDNDSPGTLERLQVLRDSDDGFYLAEKDLEQRGAGQLFGLRQHGLPDLYIADILQDMDILIEARELAKKYIQNRQMLHEIEQALDSQFDKRFQRIFYS